MKKYFSAWIMFMSMSNGIFANVTLSIGDVDVEGYTDEIIVPVSLSNPNDEVGGFQFDLKAYPTLVNLSSVSLPDPDNFTADFNIFNDGLVRVIFFHNSGGEISAGGDGVVLNLHFSGSNVLSALIEIEAYDLAVSNGEGELVASSLEYGSLTIGDVVHMSASIDTGDVLEQVYLDINLENSGSVGGLQFDIVDSPNYVDVISLSTTARTEGFSIDLNVLPGGATRVLLYSPQNNDIAPGDGPIANMQMQVHDDAYNSNVSIDFLNVTVTDGIGGSYWIASADSGTVTVSPGYIEEPSNLQAQNGMDAQVVLTWTPPAGPTNVFVDENLDSGVPENWEIIDGGMAGSTWQWVESYGGQTLDGTPFIYADADAAGNGSEFNDEFISPTFSTSGELYLSFDHFFLDYSGDNVASFGNVDVWNGTEWVNVYQATGNGTTIGGWSGPDQQILDLSNYSNAQFKLRFNYITDPASWEWYWAVDNIRLTNFLEEGRYSATYELSQRGWDLIQNGTREEMREVFLSNNWPYGYVNPETFDLIDNSTQLQNQLTRPLDIGSYKIYRSLDMDTDYEEIGEVDGSVTQYTDTDVLNSVTYYYYVTAVYPDGSESGPTNVISGTPIEWVELWMDNGASLSGQPDTIDFYINNESNIGLFYFEVTDYPDVLNGLSVLPTPRTYGFAMEITDQGDGTIAITAIGIDPNQPLVPGDGAVCKAIIYPDAEEEMTVNLSFSNGTSIQDVNFVDLNWQPFGGPFSYEVGIETQYLNLIGGFGNSGFSTEGSVFLQNTQDVYAMQFDIVADPPLIVGTSLQFNELYNMNSWTFSGVETQPGSYRITAFDNTLSNPIEPGMGHLLDITYDILDGIPDGTMIDINVSDPVLTDENDLPMFTEGSPHAFYIGDPPCGLTIDNVSGSMSPGAYGTFEVHMTNTETVNILEFVILDMPNYMVVTDVYPLGRFSDGIIDGSTGESENGSFYFLGYDFASSIEPGNGPILEIEVQFQNNLTNPSVVFMFDDVSAGDINTTPIMAWADGFGQYINTLDVVTENSGLPNRYFLHPNYPNPFNPSTVISYDIANDSRVELNVFDMRGRLIKNLVNQNQSVGRYNVTWNGSDNLGNTVSAGVYIYKLNAGAEIFSRKMVLMK